MNDVINWDTPNQELVRKDDNAKVITTGRHLSGAFEGIEIGAPSAEKKLFCKVNFETYEYSN